MLSLFASIFVVDTKITLIYNFVAPLSNFKHGMYLDLINPSV